MEDFIKNWVIPLVTLGGILVAIVLFITRKDEKQEVDIVGISKDIQSLTKNFEDFKNNNFAEFKKDVNANLDNIKNNHLHTLQDSVNALSKEVASIDNKVCMHLKVHEVLEKERKLK